MIINYFDGLLRPPLVNISIPVLRSKLTKLQSGQFHLEKLGTAEEEGDFFSGIFLIPLRGSVLAPVIRSSLEVRVRVLEDIF